MAAMSRLLPTLVLALGLLAPAVALADVPANGRGCSRCSVDDDEAPIGLAATALLGLAAWGLRRRPK